MLNKKITIQFTNTTSDYRRVLYRLQAKRLTIIAIAFLLVVLPVLWLIYLSSMAEIFINKGSAFSLMIIIFAVYLPIYAIVIIFKVRQQARATEDILEPTEFTFSENGVDSISPSSSHKVSWITFVKIQEQKEDFLLYPQKNFLYVIPKRAFRDEPQMKDFRNLIREKMDTKATFIN